MPVLVSRVDHVYARVPNPRALFRVLTQRFGLPRTYGYTRLPLLEGGAVAIGDIVFVEALRYAPERKMTPAAGAGLAGLALESDFDLPEAATELSARGIPHFPPYSFKGDPGPFAFGGPLSKAGLRSTPGTIWSMVVIGGLLGERRLARLGRLLPKRGDSRLAAISGRMVGTVISNARLGPVAMARTIGPHPTVWLHEFHVADIPAARAAAVEQLRRSGGGELGLERVREIVLTSQDLPAERERWERLLQRAPSSSGVWSFASGPSLRLVEGALDRIEALVCDVRSLEVAAQFLERERMLRAADGSEIRVASEPLQGLEIRLRRSPPGSSPPSERRDAAIPR
jgi:hypothetical protein